MNDYLLHTSVTDARASLECQLGQHPMAAARTSLTLLSRLQDQPGQIARRRMLAGVLRKAAIEVAEQPASSKDLPMGVLRQANVAVARHIYEHWQLTAPAEAANSALIGLEAIQGNPREASRRRMLLTVIRQVASSLSRDQGRAVA
ncbi:hypothetical protein L861_06380 [Litchfieldella anticariensis FP35 = DSM 16096]|uniref:Uncharacterized protein n=1 Tax=Litchfieldella anticariensis (strain DSM 16096 / CECT 5854 / CIP 108499 / LMG 22089 / FP35) TaxID=1121939 RepID=S2KF72_LITA3|nr:hypothetical protein [Halomonas anticariensis]EPC00560.1 hypothetical protein L861_06380 [Halomonas anticariensis FP35 = DSM 16096]